VFDERGQRKMAVLVGAGSEAIVTQTTTPYNRGELNTSSHEVGVQKSTSGPTPVSCEEKSAEGTVSQKQHRWEEKKKC